MANLQEQIAQAKAAGYTDDQITKHLSTRADLAPKIKQATEAGYKADQIVAHLAGAPSAAPTPTVVSKTPADAKGTPWMLTSVAAGLGKGVGEVALGAQKLVGKGIQLAGETITPDKQTLSGLVSGKKDRGLIQSAGDWLVNDADAGKAKLTAELAPYKAANPVSAGVGEIGGNVLATLPVGGGLASGVRAVAPVLTRAGVSAPTVNAVANSLATGGFRAGAPGALSAPVNMLARVGGGAVTGGVSATLVDPANAGTGALIGGALPPVLWGAGKALGYAGRSVNSLVQPFTEEGQKRIAGKVINRFAEDGPTVINNAEIVPGSIPTLAEATGNAGIASLQRNVSELRPNMFAERQASNAAARTAAFDEVAGDVGKLDFFRASRSQAGGDLYEQALKADTTGNLTSSVKEQITQLLKRPSITEARKTAQRWAIERGEKPSFDGNMTGLHDMKTAIDDQISEAVRAGKGGEAKALANTQSKLLDVMETLSPAYKEARLTYAEMSKPINQMETLQGLRLTDAKGNMTLAKVQNAIDSIGRQVSAPGANAAKSLTSQQLETLQAIRNDLLRQTNLNAGKAAGSNTLQNIATDNAIATMLPGRVGEVVGGKVGGALGQIGRLVYSGPNETIRNSLVDYMLDPKAAEAAMAAARTAQLPGMGPRLNSLVDSTAPVLYRSAPLLSSSR